MLNAYEDWYARRNWYALYLAIVTNKGSGACLKAMGAYNKQEPGHYEVYKSSRRRNKYTKEQIDRAMKLRQDGMAWQDVANETGIPYGSLLTIYTRLKRKAVSDD